MNNKIKKLIVGIVAVFGFLLVAQSAFAAYPTMLSVPASNIDFTGATLNGVYNDGGTGSVDVRFEYGVTTSLGSSTSYVTKTGNGSYNATLTGLSANTTYYFRAMGVNSNGPAFGSPTLNFTTKSYSLSTVITTPASNIGSTTATLNGAFTGSGPTQTYFEYGTSSNSLNHLTSYLTQSGSSSFSINASNLNPNTTYYFRAVVKNSIGVSYGTPILSFTTGRSNPPQNLCQDVNATNFGYALPCTYNNPPQNLCQDHNATNYGYALPCTYNNNPPQNICRDYSATNYGYALPCTYNNNPPQNICQDRNASNYGYALPCTYLNNNHDCTYYNNCNNQYSLQPQAVSGIVSSLKDTSVVLHGRVYTNGIAPTYVYFEFGTTPSMGIITAKYPVYSSSTNFIKSLSNLNPNTTYYFRLVAENSNGIGKGDILYFTTAQTGQRIVTPTVINYTKTTNNSDNSSTTNSNSNSNQKGSLLGASAGSAGSFLPATALGWLLLIIFILVLFMIVRYFVTRESPNQLHR